MGLFRELGRQVEEFKSKAMIAADERAAFQCQKCGARFGDEYEQCPECESEEIVSVERRE